MIVRVPKRVLLAIVLAAIGLMWTTIAVWAEGESGPFSFDNGFAKLASIVPSRVGEAISPEMPGEESGSVVQFTDKGLLYWRGAGHAAVFFDGEKRAALVDGELVQWTGSDLEPPAEEQVIASVGGYTARVRITYYDLSGATACGYKNPFPGSTACSSNFACGTKFVLPNGETFVCADRGRLGSTGWLDLYERPDLAHRYEPYVNVRVVP